MTVHQHNHRHQPNPTLEIINALKETLQRTGTLDTIRAQLRADVFQCITECLPSLSASKSAPSTQSSLPAPPIENILINEIIAEYLAFNGYQHTLSVFASETGNPSLQSNSGYGSRSCGNKFVNCSINDTDASVLGLEFIRADLGLNDKNARDAGGTERCKTTLPMMYEIIETMKRRSRGGEREG